jgi:hypothetical protein
MTTLLANVGDRKKRLLVTHYKGMLLQYISVIGMIATFVNAPFF